MNKVKFEKANPEFVSEVSALSIKELDTRLAALAKDIKTILDAKEADEDLAARREAAKEAGRPYSEALKLTRAKSLYIVGLVERKP